MYSFKRKIGNSAEDLALNYLLAKKLKLIKRNYLTKLGEIDIIMTDKDTLVFIEVRFKKSNNFGFAFETINKAKQDRIIKTAQHFLQNNSKYKNFICRFDVININYNLKYNNVDWIIDAFQV